jgi:hypothetical protein
MMEGVVRPEALEAEDYGVIVERLDLLGAHMLETNDRAVRSDVQLVAVHHVMRGHQPPSRNETRPRA